MHRMRSGLYQRMLLVVGLSFAAAAVVAFLRAGPGPASAQSAAPAQPSSRPEPAAMAAPPKAKPPVDSNAPIRPSGNGWLMRQTNQGTLLLHLPPRDMVGSPTGAWYKRSQPGGSSA